ncbi:SH3 domain-containing protein [Leptospira idonii]|uniref:SH3 domain-containing protein n=1 Tax=Leptospira idonii TaxID=1193500 RepID=A0A4R9LZG6_9LEPT|nr:SH3 domain-containing protein [Leptospira idonii]TGN19021.1 SH3 domain-containing protein [Leptospira idonii]
MSSFRFVLVCVFISLHSLTPIFAEGHWDNILPEKKENTDYFVFGENVNIREKTDLKSKVIKKLQPGDKVKVLQKTKSLLTQDKIKEYWYKIKTDKEEGYVWGSLLADYQFTVGKHTILARNLGPIREGIELKSVKDRKVISELKLAPGPVGNEAWGVVSYESVAFKPNPGTLFGLKHFVFSEIEYGYTNETIISIDQEGKLSGHFSWLAGSCDPPACAESWLVFPNQTLPADSKIKRKTYKGHPNTILEVSRNYDIEDESATEYYERHHIWNGRTFQEKRGD